MTRTEALKALDTALWRARAAATPTSILHIQVGHAIDALSQLKTALAQPEQEPVAWADHGVVNWIVDKQFKHASYLYEGQPPASFKACVYCGQMVVKEKNT